MDAIWSYVWILIEFNSAFLLKFFYGMILSVVDFIVRKYSGIFLIEQNFSFILKKKKKATAFA